MKIIFSFGSMIINRCALETSHQNTSSEYIDCIDISKKNSLGKLEKKVSTKFDDSSRIQKFRFSKRMFEPDFFKKSLFFYFSLNIF